MIEGIFNRLFSPDLVFSIPALLVALTVHEYAHAYVAVHFGDPTPRYTGRLTLNPIAHLDPIGLLMLLLVQFGWAKPVSVNSRYFKDGRTAMRWVALAGPLTNLLIAFLTGVIMAILIKLGLITGHFYLHQVLVLMITYNLGFAFFNLLPFPPLDGFNVLVNLLPGRQAYALSRLASYGIWLPLLAAMLIGPVIVLPFVKLGLSLIELLMNLIIVL